MTDTPLSDDVVERVREAVIAAAQAGGGSYRRDIDCVAGNPTRIARAALEAARYGEIVAEMAELRAERNALLEKPIDMAKMDSIDEDASGKMVAYYWWQQAQDARALLSSIGASQP